MAALAATVVIGLVVHRTLRVPAAERDALLAVGWRRRDLIEERVAEGAAIAGVAMIVAAVVAAATTAAFPVGILRTFEPDPGVRVELGVTAIGVAVLALVVIGAAAASAARPAWRRTATADGTAGWLAQRGGMPLSVGVHFTGGAGRGRRAGWLPLAAGVFGVAGLLAAGAVGLSLRKIVDRPERWGAGYDQLFGNPYAPAAGDLVSTIGADPDVAAVAGASLGAVSIDGTDTATIGFVDPGEEVVPTVLDGRAPRADDELAIGAEVARRLGVGIGDRVEVVGATATAEQFEIVGIVATPDSAGNGAAMIFDAFRRLNPSATVNLALVRYTEGAPASAAERIAAANYTPPGALTTPPSIRALERAEDAPLLLVAVLAVLLAAGGVFLLAASVRSRRRDLQILRALGAKPIQLRAAIQWQATLATALVVAIGVPVGVVGGRRVVLLVTDALGIVPGAEVPIGGLAVVAGSALLLANVVALRTSRQAVVEGALAADQAATTASNR